tara:strand:- start:65 stop:298 length:234 start_codon:yes stop_codon:yes gene_type:complete
MSDPVTNDNDLLLFSEGDKNRLGPANQPTDPADKNPPTPPNNTQMGDPIRLQEILKYINLNRSLHILKSDKFLTILE